MLLVGCLENLSVCAIPVTKQQISADGSAGTWEHHFGTLWREAIGRQDDSCFSKSVLLWNSGQFVSCTRLEPHSFCSSSRGLVTCTAWRAHARSRRRSLTRASPGSVECSSLVEQTTCERWEDLRCACVFSQLKQSENAVTSMELKNRLSL